MSDNIKVVVKVRPLISREIEDKLYYQWRVKNNTLYQIDQTGRDYGASFTFDKVYDKDTKTSDVYNDIAKPIVEAATAGFNGTIFAYGQTSSGKTYTMTGTNDSPGIIPLSVLNLFEIIKNIPDRDFLVRVSFVEIYNETLTDLLDTEKKVKIQETLQGVKVDATEKYTTSPEEVLDIMMQGKANRQTASTNMNDESSRSHSIFQITIESREHIEGEEEVGSVNVSQLNLVDLAGSERAGQTGATGLRFKEGTHINKSLSALALVIKQLSEDQNKHVNYRDSKLTRILQNSLGGNAKTSIICAVTPAAVEETISTLQFANRAKAIKNTPAVNAVANNSSMIQTLTKQLSSLKTALENKKNVEQHNSDLQRRIERLQKVIINGFHQRSNTDLITGARKKLYQPRRMTISTLHPIQEDSVPSVIPKFCTPSLKYNPLALPATSDFVPIRESGSLSSLKEETPRTVTPPLMEKKVNFNNEIINLDSDDDSPPEPACSPYHKCYESSKTPPCVLRKHAKIAEKNLKEIVELTEREKQYSPNIVELLEKLEEKSIALTKLEDDVVALNALCIEKDSVIDNLKSRIGNVESDIQSLSTNKTDLEAKCKEYQTKLTDSEVSYETLLKKSKNREKELLSLLEDETNKNKSNANGTHLSMEGLDKAKSTSTKSINTDENLTLNQNTGKISELQAQLTLREQTILELEATVYVHKQKADSLDIINKELQEMLTNYKQNVLLAQNENVLLISKVRELTHVIESQKAEIKAVSADVESYNSVIQELQIKLTDHVTKKIVFNDEEINDMIEQEKMLIASNENVKNIIQALKFTLDAKNNELLNLKSAIDSDSIKSRDELNILYDKINSLQEDLNYKETLIHELKSDNAKFISTEQQLLSQLKNIEISQNNLEKLKLEMHLEIESLRKDKENLSSEHINFKEESEGRENKLNSEIEILSQKLKSLEDDIKMKDEYIEKLNCNENEGRENLATAKVSLAKLQEIILLLSGNIHEVPEILDDFVMAFKFLSEKLIILENIVKSHVEEKEELKTILQEHESEISKLKRELDTAHNILENVTIDFTGLINVNEQNNCASDSLSIKLKNVVEQLKIMHNNLQQQFKDKECEIHSMKSDIQVKELELENKYFELGSLNENLNKINECLTKKDNLLHEVQLRIQNGVTELNIQRKFSPDSVNNDYENIFDLIDQLINYARSKELVSPTKTNNMDIILSEAKKEINELRQQNIKLNQDIEKIEVEKDALCKEIETVYSIKKGLEADLKHSDTVLNELKEDLQIKASEIKIFESKAKDWKQQFIEIDTILKDQISELENENANLRDQLDERSEHSLNRCYHHQSFKKKSDTNAELLSPPSLLKICCDRIVEATLTNDTNECVSASSSSTQFRNSDLQINCRCSELAADIATLKNDNIKLKEVIEKLQNDNQFLIKEHEEAQKEIYLLLESSSELHKKLMKHRTNLSTLTATTYAENKSLSTQLKFLQHYHSLFYKACQKDIPEFKKQLQDLLLILKSEYTAQQQNDSFRRHSLPNALENSMVQTSFKYESMLDGDLLMLDTNITLTTCDNTFTGNDQTCFDVTQTSSEIGCQTTNCIELPVAELKTKHKLLDSLDCLRNENNKLRDLVEEHKLNKTKNANLVNTQTSPFTSPNKVQQSCEKCKQFGELLEQNKTLEQILIEIKNKKIDLETKYNNLMLETPSTEALIVKLKNLEKDHQAKAFEVDKLTTTLNKKNEELRILQEENDSLSNQVMENIDEVDSLRNEVESLKENNMELANKVSVLETAKAGNTKEETNVCSECILKEETINLLQYKIANEPHKRLSRSYSDSDSSSRYNKICTLQNELHAGREDCNELKNEVTNIRNHLERSNMSIGQAMELDDSMGDAQPIAFDKHCDSDTQYNKSNMPDIPEERPVDLYSLDKVDCVNFCIQKTGVDRETFNCDMKIVDVMKLLYDNFITKHSNEVENLTNKLRDFEESKSSLQTKINNLMDTQAKLNKESEEKDMYLQTLAKVVAQVKQNLTFLSDTTRESDVHEVIDYFKDNFFMVIDKQFGLTSVELFEIILSHIKDKYELEISKSSDENKLLQNQMQSMFEELKSARNQYDVLKAQLSENENDKNLLMRQKEKMFEISNAVTLNIVKKEDELKLLVGNVYQKLVERNIINPEAIDISLPSSEAIPILFEFILNKQCDLTLNDEYNNLKHELNELKQELADKNKILQSLKEEYEKLNGVHSVTRIALNNKETEMKNQETLHEALKNVYEKKLEENEANLIIIAKFSDEVNLLKDHIDKKETVIQTLQTQLHNEKQNKYNDNEHKLTELATTIQELNEDVQKLKSANRIILQEKETACLELEKASDVIKQNKVQMEKMLSDILILKESVNENSSVMENLKLESKTLLDQNSSLKEQIQEKTKECSRLEMNIKTHQKTAEIQSKMIIRLQKEKTDSDKTNDENVKKLEEMTEKLNEIQRECEHIKVYKEEIESLKKIKQSLEERITELEDELRGKARASLEASAEAARSRRQSLYDSMRTFSESGEDHKKMEAVFKSRKCDELFMDVDDSSSRSSPVGLSKGRDSLSSKRDQSEEDGSRASSVQASRRRRQSIHDALRSVSALEMSRRNSEDRNNDSTGSDTSSEVAKLRKQLAACQEELEDLKEKYKDLDQECETCAEYLRERDEQCRRLKKEKKDLENSIQELKQKILSSVPHKEVQHSTASVAVNTDEDWTHLHSVVVDRMSYDAEVEKNKKLMKIIEEVRYKKQELQNTMNKMQKSIERHAHKDKELESARTELTHLKREVEELRVRCRELDEECDTCAQYLKERDEQCRRLKEAKNALEMKIKEYQESSLCMSVRKKRRQTLHDQNRRPETDCADVATETSDDFLSYQVEKDENSKKSDEKHAEEVRRLKMVVERLSQQKAMLEQQVLAVSAAAPLYVATGSAIVQNQQIADVMKENQKLKKINAKLVKICKKEKSMNRENEDPADDNK